MNSQFVEWCAVHDLLEQSADQFEELTFPSVEHDGGWAEFANFR
jgi:hypothetical protein